VSLLHGLRAALVTIGVSLCAAGVAAAQTTASSANKPATQSPAPSSAQAPPAQPAPATPARPATATPAQPVTSTPPQAPAPTRPTSPAGAQQQPIPTGIQPPPGYVIGPRDQLAIVFWRDKDMSTDVAVRPDGRISLPLINEIDAAGLTPDQLRDRVSQAASRYIADPTVSVVVKQINSRQVFITGEVNRPGSYPLMAPTSVMQLISLAGGLREYAKEKDIVILRNEGEKQTAIPFNYRDVVNRRKLGQNIMLQPGDTVIVP
jgi:polysaccharide biosynthesis/export protein